MPIDLKENNYSMLRSRFDEDMALYYLEKFELQNPETGKKIDNALSITLNDPRTYGDRCLSILSADNKRFEITGVDKSIQPKIEQNFENWLYVNDEQLELQGIEPLEDVVNFLDLFRGWIGAVVLFYQDGDKYIPYTFPVDPRWATWEHGAKGLSLLSYRTRLEREVAEEKFKIKFAGNSQIVDFQSIWTAKEYVIYQASDTRSSGIIGDPVKTVEHGIGICPGLMIPVPIQPMLVYGAEDYAVTLSRQGESIYAPNRDTYHVLNKVCSILASIMQEAYLASYVYHGEKEGVEGNLAGGGKLISVAKDEKIDILPTRDLNRATEYLFGILGSAKQRGSLSDINYGQIAFELSALAVAQLKDDREGIFVPRRKAKKTFYRRVFEILRHQVLHGGYKTTIDDDDAITINKSLFEKKPIFNVNFSSISPEENITNLTIANQAIGIGLPKEYVFRHYLHIENPEDVIRQGKLEQAYQHSPLLQLYDEAIACDPGVLTEAQINSDRATILMHDIKLQLDQAQATQMPEVPGMASQPKNTTKLNRASSEKIAQAKLNESGIMAAQNSKRESNIGG